MACYPTFTLDQIYNMEYTEALLRLEAYALNRVYIRQDMAIQSFFDRQANAVDDNGRFVVKDIKEMYNAQDAIDKITGKQQRKESELQERYKRYQRAKKIAQEEMRKERG